MHAIIVSVALACTVQVALGSPDFGLPVDVPGTAPVLKWGLAAKNNFLRVDDYIMPAQKSDIVKLGEAATFLTGIGQQVNSLGPALIDTITTATEDDTGEIETAYELIDYALIMFEGYIDGALQVTIQSIEALLGYHVRDQLIDDFFHIRARLDKLRDTIETLQTAVEDATAAAAGGPLSPELVAQFVGPALVAQLGRHLALLAHRIPVLIYTLTSTLENIQQADDYFFGLMEDTSRVLEEIGETGTDFYNAALQYQLPIGVAMNALITEYEDDLSSAVSTATSLDVADLSLAVSGFATIRSTNLGATLSSYLERYETAVEELSQLFPIETNFFFEQNEHPAGVLVHVLIANGPFSRFCFWKYASVLHNLLLVSNYASECLERELDRLITLQEALLVQIELIQYDLEIIAPYSAVCLSLPASTGLRDADCAQELGNYFLVLYNSYTTKLAEFLRLLDIEMLASKNRASVCWSTRMQQSFLQFQNLVPDILACGESGPNA